MLPFKHSFHSFRIGVPHIDNLFVAVHFSEVLEGHHFVVNAFFQHKEKDQIDLVQVTILDPIMLPAKALVVYETDIPEAYKYHIIGVAMVCLHVLMVCNVNEIDVPDTPIDHHVLVSIHLIHSINTLKLCLISLEAIILKKLVDMALVQFILSVVNVADF